MSASVLVLVLLAGAALFASFGVLRHAPRYRAALVALQWLAAAALYLFLFPPAGERGALVVLTRGASAAQVATLPAGADVIALPEAYDCAPPDCLAPESVRALRVPDLATALRAHPGATVLQVLGSGLAPRDRDAARGLALRFEPPPGPHGFTAIDAPAHVPAGSNWTLAGHVRAPAGVRVELRDPGDAVVATATPGGDGAFRFAAPSRLPGPASFKLRLLGDGDTVIDELPVPLAAEAAQPARVLLLAGAPDPELKYLRRWALDAGIALEVRVAIGPDTTLGAAAAPRDAATLADYALAVVDERAWAALAAEQRRALAEAVDAGLGLLLRVTGPAAKPVADDWRALGFTFAKAEIPQGVTLARALALEPASAAFARVPLSVQAGDATSLLRDDDGDPLALMRAQGRGRVALWWLQDSFRLALAGSPERHATLWSRVFTTLARTRDDVAPETPRYAWVGRRAALCGLAGAATVQSPGDTTMPLIVDPATGSNRCAAFWPERPGWHVLTAGERRAWFHVMPANEGRALADALDRSATAELVALHAAPTTGAVPALPWRWLAALLALVSWGALWWLERRAAIPQPGA